MSSISPVTISPYTAAASPVRRADTTSSTTGSSSTTGTSSTASASSNSSQLSVSALGSTFLQLLTQELQNQDPTAPVDSTQMVGQMISLNQLDQLANINQTLTNQFPTAAGTTSASTSPTSSSQGAAAAGMSQASVAAAVQAAMQALNTSAATNSALSQVSLPSL